MNLVVITNLRKVPSTVVMLMVRSRFEIMAEILSLCKQPQNKTKGMYGTNLSWQMAQKYLSQLQSWGLLELHDSSIKYATTRKGLKFIEKWRELIEPFMHVC
ncbi:MAG: winged helix-turn-helix domain-containing protein [Candidatus Bathyarchaeota archaeon]|jgi:predicted transcriptional regulator